MRRPWVIGIDFGGTVIKIGLAGPAGRVVRQQALASREAARPPQFVEMVGVVAERMLRQVGAAPASLRGIGIGVPGLVDARRGIVRTLVNVPGWRDVPLARRIERRVRRPCLIENDANLFALGEWTCGAGRGARHLVGVTLGTGVGGGLVLDGRVHRGASGAAGELGHMAITRSRPAIAGRHFLASGEGAGSVAGRRCGCGRRGCLEAHIGTAAMLSYGRRAVRQGAEPLGRLVRSAGGRLTPALISQAARQGDRHARRIWEFVGSALGAGLANVVNLLNPDRIIIGGGFSNAWSLFYPRLIATVRAEALSVSAAAVAIRRARLGNRAGIVGAAVLVWNEFE